MSMRRILIESVRGRLLDTIELIIHKVTRLWYLLYYFTYTAPVGRSLLYLPREQRQFDTLM